MESTGERLKKIRQEKGLSLEEVQKKTKIHLSILKALEGEGLTNLSPIYLKGFFKIYCRFLGVDPKEYIPGYKEATAPATLSATQGPEEEKPLKPPSFLENASLKLNSFRPDARLRKIIISALIIIIFGVIVFKIGKFISSRPRARPLPAAVRSQEEKTPVKPQAKERAVASKAQISEARLPRESSGGLSLVISAKENCLIFVKVDGRVVLHRVLEKGRSDSWKAKEKIELALGNAGAVELVVNGRRFANLGRRGQQLKNIVITEKDGLRIPR